MTILFWVLAFGFMYLVLVDPMDRSYIDNYYTHFWFFSEFPSIGHMLHFSVEDGYTLNGTSVVDGIHCNKFVSMEVKVPAINGSFHVEYHWTGNKYMHN